MGICWKNTGICVLAGLAAVTALPVLSDELSDYDCLIEPHAVVEISTREEGVMEEITVKRGDFVKKGQVLARLESEVEELAVELARARAGMRFQVEARQADVKYLKGQHGRVNDLFEKKAIPFHEKDKAYTDLILAEAQLREAKENYRIAQIEKKRAEQLLERRTIRSSVDGVIVEVLMEPGESVEDRPILIVAQVDPLNVEVILSEKLYGTIDVGSQAEVQPLLRGAEPKVAPVVVVDRVIDAASNTFGVRLELPNPDYALPGGIRCKLEFLSTTD